MGINLSSTTSQSWLHLYTLWAVIKPATPSVLVRWLYHCAPLHKSYGGLKLNCSHLFELFMKLKHFCKMYIEWISSILRCKYVSLLRYCYTLLIMLILIQVANQTWISFSAFYVQQSPCFQKNKGLLSW